MTSRRVKLVDRDDSDRPCSNDCGKMAKVDSPYCSRLCGKRHWEKVHGHGKQKKVLLEQHTVVEELTRAERRELIKRMHS